MTRGAPEHNLSSFGRSAGQVLSEQSGEVVVLTSQSLPAPPAELQSESLVLVGRPHRRHYSAGHAAYWCDEMEFFAGPEDYRALGLLVLACVLHRARSIIRLAWTDRSQPGDEGTPITELVIDYIDDDDAASVLIERPVAYSYDPAPVHDRHPLGRGADDARTPSDSRLPTLLWDDGIMYGLGPDRTVANGFGSGRGAAAFAALLMDFALPGSYRETSVQLEGHAGNQAVSLQSTEIRLHLGYQRY